MFQSLLNLFKRPTKPAGGEDKKITADGVRIYAKVAFVTPARQRGDARATFTASELYRGLDQRARYPFICDAIDTRKFEEFARVKLIKREGAKQGATARWTFKVL